MAILSSARGRASVEGAWEFSIINRLSFPELLGSNSTKLHPFPAKVLPIAEIPLLSRGPAKASALASREFESCSTSTGRCLKLQNERPQ